MTKGEDYLRTQLETLRDVLTKRRDEAVADMSAEKARLEHVRRMAPAYDPSAGLMGYFAGVVDGASSGVNAVEALLREYYSECVDASASPAPKRVEICSWETMGFTIGNFDLAPATSWQDAVDLVNGGKYEFVMAPGGVLKLRCVSWNPNGATVEVDDGEAS